LSVETPNNMIISHRLAEHIGLEARTVWAGLRRGASDLELKSGMGLKRGERVVIVVDVMATGHIARKLIELSRKCEVAVGAVCSLVDVSPDGITFSPLKTISLTRLPLGVFSPESCPMCREGVPMRRLLLLPRW